MTKKIPTKEEIKQEMELHNADEVGIDNQWTLEEAEYHLLLSDKYHVKEVYKEGTTMNRTKHTPAPLSESVILSMLRERIKSPELQEQIKADAKLWASAPELLGACKEAQYALNKEGYKEPDGVMYLLNQAINKAESK